VRKQAFTAQEIKRREAAWIRIQTKEGSAAADVVKSVGEGYEPAQGHLMPFSTRTPAGAMLSLLKRE
jgi:hypothetical protein